MKRAFTLAEILITLSIIGVIAAMVIPSLVQDTKDAEIYTKWRKTFADVSQATIMLNTLYNGIDFTNESTMRDSYEKVMQFVNKGAWKDFSGLKYRYYKNTAGQGWDTSSWDIPSAVLPSGIIIRFGSYGINGGNGSCTAQVNSLTNICGYFWIDLNGKKGPNMFGKDFMPVWIVKKQGKYMIYAIGSNGDGWTCQPNSNNETTSDGCSALALRTDNMP